MCLLLKSRLKNIIIELAPLKEDKRQDSLDVVQDHVLETGYGYVGELHLQIVAGLNFHFRQVQGQEAGLVKISVALEKNSDAFQDFCFVCTVYLSVCEEW